MNQKIYLDNNATTKVDNEVLNSMLPYLKEEYKVSDLPSLLIFRNQKYLGKVEGYYNTEQKENFIEEINKILN